MDESALSLSPDALAIKERLSSDEITWLEALKLLKGMPKPWHRKEWKIARDKLIKPSCERCDTSEGIMVLNHLQHPPSHSAIVNELCRKTGLDIQDFKDALSYKYNKLISKVPMATRECCPKCYSTAVTYRKKADNWRCSGSKTIRGRKITCNHVFNPPATKNDYSLAQKREISKIKASWYQEASVNFDGEKDKLAKPAVMLSFECTKRYLSFVDTETFCKKCAFLWDQKGMAVCRQCKHSYMPRYMDNICACCIDENALAVPENEAQ